MHEPVRVLYVMGSGRSGSTVLDTILGSHPRIESVGELSALTRSGWQAGALCACGSSVGTCPFWSGVRARLDEAGVDLPRHAELQRRFEDLHPLPRVLRAARRDSADFRRWARGTVALFRAVAAEGGRPVVADSSKAPVRGLALSLAGELDVFLIHLVRDARGVACSLARPHARDPRAGVERDLAPRSPARSALFWAAVNAAADRVRRRVGAERSLLLRYEDYVRDLGRALAPLAEFVGADLAPLAASAAAGEELPVGHTVAGNRLRMAGRVRLEPDERWRTEVSPRTRKLVYALTRPWMRRYGYPP